MTPAERAYLCGFWDGEAGRYPCEEAFKSRAERTLYRRGYTFARFISPERH